MILISKRLHVYTLLYFSIVLLFPKATTAQKNGYAIIQEKCTSCHLKSDIAPYDFSKISVIVQNAKTIEYTVSSGFMPLWFANPEVRHFYDERVLSNTEKKTILDWVHNLEPNAKQPPPYPLAETNHKDEKHLKASTSVTTANSYNFENLQDKVFINFSELGYPLPEYIKGAILSFSDKKIVHHAVVYGLDSASKNYTLAKNSPTSDLNINAFGDINLGVYAPGLNYALLPDGFGYKANKTKGLLIEKHLLNLGDETKISTTTKFYYSQQHNVREVKSLNLTNLNKNEPIEPNTIKTFKGKAQLDDSISVLALMPHMHKIATHFYAFAITPKSDTIPLLELKRWSFDWQTIYRLDTLLPLPKETMIHYEATFDNTAANPSNPSSPPEIVWVNRGWSTKNEMLVFGLQYTAFQKGDEGIKLNWIDINNNEVID